MIQTAMNSLKGALKILGTSTLFVILSFQAANAGYPPLYDVEVIVFLDKKADAVSNDLMIPGIKRLSDSGRSFPEGEFTELDYRFYQLKGVTESLQESSDYDVLFHRAWRQLAYNRRDAVPYSIDPMVSTESEHVAGTVKLVNDKSLFLDVNVLLMSSETQSDPSIKRPVQQLMKKQQVVGDKIYYLKNPNLNLIAKVTPYRKNECMNYDDSRDVSSLLQKLALR